MYQESSNKIDLIKIILRVILFFLIVILTVKLISIVFNKRKTLLENNSMNSNLNKMQEVAVKFFNDGNITIGVGEISKTSLKELIEKNYIEELKDEHKEVCSNDNSYIEILRLDNEYRIKSYLECNNNNNYTYTYIDSKTNKEEKGQDPTTEPTTTSTTKTTTQPVTTTTTSKKTTKTTTTKKTTKKVVTTKPTTSAIDYVSVSFYPNGGEYIKPIAVKKGGSVTLPTPIRSGYTFVYWVDLDGNKVGNTITVNKNIILKPVWIK